MTIDLDFEAPLAELEAELEKARESVGRRRRPLAHVDELQRKLESSGSRDYIANLSAWQKVQVGRHPQRPLSLDYLRLAFTDFTELHGDRKFGDDAAIVGGPAMLDGTAVMVVGHQRGHDTRENGKRNFGMPSPEGYRKAQRLFRLAERMALPVITLVDTPGANVGVADEERGQVEAIATCIAEMYSLRVPTVAVIIGQGNSGGALALGVADQILMLEHSTSSVLIPRQASSIIWRSRSCAEAAEPGAAVSAAQDMRNLASSTRLSGADGGAHRDPAAMADAPAGCA